MIQTVNSDDSICECRENIIVRESFAPKMDYYKLKDHVDHVDHVDLEIEVIQRNNQFVT